jgi:hypothetical protein
MELGGAAAKELGGGEIAAGVFEKFGGGGGGVEEAWGRSWRGWRRAGCDRFVEAGELVERQSQPSP